jgi:hypothetical protein
MNYFNKIWTTIKIFFVGKKKKSDIKVYQDAKAIIEKGIDKEEILKKASNATNDEEKKEILKPLVEFESAKQIVEVIEKKPEIFSEEKSTIKRKKLYDLNELENEITHLQSKLSLLELRKSSIKEVPYPDTSSFDERINKLFSLLNKNKVNEKVKFSDFTVSALDKDLKQLEKLLSDKSVLKLHKTREQEKRRQREIYESNIKKELNNLETLIGQNKLDDAKQLVNRLSKSIKPDYKKGIERLSRARAKLKEKELEIFKKRQAELLRQQQEEVERIRIEQEKKVEQKRLAREQAVALRKIEEAKKAEKKNKLKTLLTKKFNWRDFQKILQENGIAGFYHFTDRSNLKSIKENGGLFSWYYCDLNRIEIPMPGGSLGSRQNDTFNGKKDFVRVAFNKEHPMLFIALRDGRISKPVWLDIDIEVAYFEHTEFSDKNAAAFSSYTPIIGKETKHLSNIRFDILKKAERVKHYNIMDNEKPYNQAEVLVKTWIPLEYIKNIESLAQ